MNNSSAQPIIIDVKGLTKSFNGKKAVDNLTLKVPSGIIFGFMGANGSGKTTTLRLLCGLLLPDKGSGHCLGLDLFTQTKEIQAQIGYMPQSFCLYRNLSVYENLDFIGRMYALKQRPTKLANIIKLFNLEEKQNQLAYTLSVGWQQRVALAAALVHNPRLLLLDEPTSGVDPQSRILIWNHIQELVRTGVTVLLSTQFMDEAERCHQLTYMSNGKILTHGSSQEIIQDIGLTSWRIVGNDLKTLTTQLKKYIDGLQIIEKGHEIRINSLNPNAIQKIDPTLLKDYEIQTTPTTLEDVFIYKIQHEENQ